ncbi:hypothetical protein PBR20603_02094 [Pandoraea bronchicola]|uniref:Uncharacterized protein n=2 Tax=Pandoraea bronchicola TaxID=2508287 RepID=A0A5E5BSU3_9BURK|nr:hypothetical protein PBR20603_02094 [Pandoraea bronchicola]
MRPLEGMWRPLEVRQELRQSFKRWLSWSNEQPSIIERDGLVDELSLLRLAQYYRLEYSGGALDLAKSWDESEERIADAAPTFKELKDLGWVFFDGARWLMQSVPMGAASRVSYPSPSTKAFLLTLSKPRLVAKPVVIPPDMQELAARILAEGWLKTRIPTRNPHWLASRLWELRCPMSQPSEAVAINGAGQDLTCEDCVSRDFSELPVADTDAVDRAFLEWSAWCCVLGVCRWNVHWGETAMRLCREAAHRVLERQSLWLDWEEDTPRFADVLIRTFSIPAEQLYLRGVAKAAPSTLVFRHDWLSLLDVEHLIMGRVGSSTVSFAFDLLCSELEETNIGPGVTDARAKILSFAADHPMALQNLLFRVNAAPELLVDMLMQPRTACLAAKLTIEGRPPVGRYSDRHVSRDAQAKAFAVQDALSLVAYHFEKGVLAPEDCASLVTWCYAAGTGRAHAVADSRKPIGRQILAMVGTANRELQAEILLHLIGQAEHEDNVPRARFMGVLVALECLSRASDVDTLPIVTLYSQFARKMQLDWTDAPSLPPELAARLVTSAFAQTLVNRDELLIPFDSAKLLASASNEDIPALRHSIARTLRVHVRLLARAVAGWPNERVPTELIDALRKLILLSAVEHSEKGRVAAITDRYSPSRSLTREDGSPAFDLAAALRRVSDHHRDTLLQALAVSDDPVLLAELCKHLPAAAKSGIQARLRQLTPGEASEFWTWPELERRIEALLVAGEYALAREHLGDIHEDLNRAPSEFRLSLFNLELRLLLNEKDWPSLDAAVVPSTLDDGAKRQAQNYLDFYGATSQLLRPNGDLTGAGHVLRRLAASPDAAPVYQENVFAVAIHQILGPTLNPLIGESKVAGEGLLAEINAFVAADASAARSNLLANRGMLLLALCRPNEALESVSAHRREVRSSNVELVAILAKSEMGLSDEAMALLDAAIAEFGETEQFGALKRDFQAGKAVPNVTSASDTIDSIVHIRAALQQLSQLSPTQVGDVLGPAGGGFRRYLMRQVSRAVSTLQQMAAMLRDRGNQADERRFENDLNSAVRAVLRASLEVTTWGVNDQSLGGATPNGNPGERDAVVLVSNHELTIYEALVCHGVDRSNIKSHFDKLLNYGVCDIYFHVTYSYAKELGPVLDCVRDVLENDVPSGLKYKDCEPLGPPDFETRGYLATYSEGRREVAIVFFVADLKVRGAEKGGLGRTEE